MSVMVPSLGALMGMGNNFYIEDRQKVTVWAISWRSWLETGQASDSLFLIIAILDVYIITPIIAVFQMNIPL